MAAVLGARALVVLAWIGGACALARPAEAPWRGRWQGQARGVCAKDHLQRFRAEDAAELVALGANAVAFTPFGSMGDPRRPELHPGTSLERTREAVRAFHGAGLRVLLKPHLWIDQSWHGAVAMDSEADWRRFFAAYGEFLLGWARFAAEEGVAALCIGTELEGTLAHEREWRALIARVRAAYPGLLTYGAHWRSFEDVPFWEALDALGVNAYFPLAAGARPEVAELERAWQPIRARLARLSARHGLPVVFTEIGYRAVEDPFTRPWDPRAGGARAPAAQARGYEAVLRVFGDEPWFGGCFWWEWFAASFPAGRPDFTPQGRPAAEVLRAAWARFPAP